MCRYWWVYEYEDAMTQKRFPVYEMKITTLTERSNAMATGTHQNFGTWGSVAIHTNKNRSILYRKSQVHVSLGGP